MVIKVYCIHQYMFNNHNFTEIEIQMRSFTIYKQIRSFTIYT